MHIASLLRQHAEDVSTKWWQRCGAIRQSDTRIEWLGELDELIDAHCDGLLEAGDAGWEAVHRSHEKSMDRNAADLRGDSFSVVALRVQLTGLSGLLACAQDTRFHSAIDDFLSWSDHEHAKRAIGIWSQDLDHPLHLCAIRHLHVHGLNGGEGLQQALLRSTTKSIAEVLDAIAHCGRRELLGHVLQLLDAPHLPQDASIRFSAARCALLLGSTGRAIPSLKQFASGNTSHALDACRLLSLVLTSGQLDDVLQTLNTPLAMRCVGWHGNPVHIPWLLERMNDPSLLPIAADSFHQICGVSVDSIAVGRPADSITSKAADSMALTQWWSAHQKDFEFSPGHLHGHKVSVESLQSILLTASQEVRETAALRYMLMSPETMLFPIAAHVDLQWKRALAMTHAPFSPKERQ